MLTAHTGMFHRTIHPTPDLLGPLSEGFCPHHGDRLIPNALDSAECPKGCEWLLMGEEQQVSRSRLIVRPNGEQEWQTRIEWDQPPIVFYMHPREWDCGYDRFHIDSFTVDWPFTE